MLFVFLLCLFLTALLLPAVKTFASAYPDAEQRLQMPLPQRTALPLRQPRVSLSPVSVDPTSNATAQRVNGPFMGNWNEGDTTDRFGHWHQLSRSRAGKSALEQADSLEDEEGLEDEEEEVQSFVFKAHTGGSNNDGSAANPVALEEEEDKDSDSLKKNHPQQALSSQPAFFLGTEGKMKTVKECALAVYNSPTFFQHNKYLNWCPKVRYWLEAKMENHFGGGSAFEDNLDLLKDTTQEVLSSRRTRAALKMRERFIGKKVAVILLAEGSG